MTSKHEIILVEKIKSTWEIALALVAMNVLKINYNQIERAKIKLLIFTKKTA